MLQNLFRKFYSYSSSCEEGSVGAYNCDPCPLVDREFGRVRSAGLVKPSYLPTLLASPTTEATWQAGIDAGDIIIIPMTSGSFDPGDQKTLKGYGDVKESYGTREMVLTWFDPNYKINYAFYNSLANGSGNYVPVFRTSSQVHIFDTVAQLTGTYNIEDDLESEVTWKGTAKVISKNLPSQHDATNLADIFRCN